VGSQVLGSSGEEIGRPPFSLFSVKAVRKASREQKLPRANPSRLLSPTRKGRAILPPAKTFGNDSNRPLPQKIRKNSQLRPSLLINENGRTPALGEYCT